MMETRCASRNDACDHRRPVRCVGLNLEAKALGRQTSNGTRMLSLLQDRLTVSAREMKALTLALQDGPLNTLSDPELHRMMSEIFRSVDELGSVFTQAAERARAARAEAAPALERLAARTDTISARIADLQQAMAASGGGLLTRAQSDSAIIKAMHGAQLQLDSLVAETKRNPLRFWF